MKKILTLLAIFCAITPFFAQNQDSIWFQANYDKKEVYVPVRDGIQLWTTIYSPKVKTEPLPILLIRTPYSCNPYGENKFPTNFRYLSLLKKGYIFVMQDVRGRWMSEGEFVDVRPFNPDKKTNKDIDEASDTYDTVDWLLKNTASNNGKVGILGISYPGFYATMGILAAHPAVKAVSPQAPVTNWFIGDDFHHNGALSLMDGFDFYKGFGQPRPKPTTNRPTEFDYPTQDNYKFYLELGALSNVKKRFFGDSIAFWNDLMQHETYDAWWQARNPTPHLKNVLPAVMTVGGFFDAEDDFGPLAVYKAIEKQNPQSVSNRLVMGPWFHGGWERSDGSYLGNVNFGSKTSEYYRYEIQMKFFEYYLKGIGDMPLAEASIFESGTNQWRFYDAWPPKNAQPATIFLADNAKISFEKNKTKKSFDEYISDPNKPVPYTEGVHLNRTREYMTDDQRFAARRPDVLTFQTDILQEDVNFSGPVTANLFVSTSSTDADFIVKVIDVYPDNQPQFPNSKVEMGGYQMLVRGDIMRGKFRDGFEKGVPFKPNKVTNVRYTMPDIAHTFQKGHRLMVQVQSTWFPLMDRNPQKFMNIHQAQDSDFQKATIRLYHDEKYPSSIEFLRIK
jgi:uncharacterized protein